MISLGGRVTHLHRSGFSVFTTVIKLETLCIRNNLLESNTENEELRPSLLLANLVDFMSHIWVTSYHLLHEKVPIEM